MLFVPGISEKMINKALDIDADSIILDLEDAVESGLKSEARALVKQAIKRFKAKNIEIIVRINDITTKDGAMDVEAIVEETPDAIIVPKADVEKIVASDILLDATELRYGVEQGEIDIIPLVETSEGILDIKAILNASSRITAVQFGAEDFTSDLGVKRTVEGDEIAFARNAIAIAGNAFKIDVIDTPFTNIHDEASLEIDAKKAGSLGFTGKACIHPNQIKVVNEVFTPDRKEVEKAEQLLEVFETALQSGKGVCTFEGAMIDKPIADRARRLVERFQTIENKLKATRKD